MKKILMFCLIAIGCNGQILLQNDIGTFDNSLTIMPSGIIGRNIGTASSFYQNLALGDKALRNNTNGTNNIAIGRATMSTNAWGDYNVALGGSALLNMEDGIYNTSLGYSSGQTPLYPQRTTMIGANTIAQVQNYRYVDNSTAIGYGAIVNDHNKIRLGDTNVTVIEGQVPWSNPSDRRLKENITYTNRLGLDFITRLQTASYNYIADKSKIRRDGFIAQDVENALSELGIPFSGLQKSEDGTYSLSYSDFVMPLVNAVKEQQEQINELKRQNDNLAQTLADLKDIRVEIAKLKEQSILRNTDKK